MEGADSVNYFDHLGGFNHCNRFLRELHAFLGLRHPLAVPVHKLSEEPQSLCSKQIDCRRSYNPDNLTDQPIREMVAGGDCCIAKNKASNSVRISRGKSLSNHSTERQSA